MQEIAAFPLEQVLDWASRITGRGVRSDRSQLTDIVREALEALVVEQPLDSVRKWCVPSCGCLVSMPKEMGHPLKYKVCDKIGPVRNQFYEFRGFEQKDCLEYRADLKFEKESPLFFELPTKGARVAARSLEKFTGGNKPQLLVQGRDIYGKEVFHVEDGSTDVGELVSIAQPHESPIYSKTIFKSISSVRILNAELNVQFIWCDVEEWGQSPKQMGLLAFYEPSDEYPVFKKYSFPMMDCSCCYNVEILAEIKCPPLKYQNELIRGFSSNAIKNMIRAIHHSEKNDIQGATFHSNLAKTNIRKNNERKNQDTDQLNFFVPTSGGGFESVS